MRLYYIMLEMLTCISVAFIFSDGVSELEGSRRVGSIPVSCRFLGRFSRMQRFSPGISNILCNGRN